MRYRFLEDITQADVAFEAFGSTLEELFLNAATATLSVMIERPESLPREQTREVRLCDEDIDHLLHIFLEKLLFFKDADALLLFPRRITITSSKAGTHELTSTLSGSMINAKDQELLMDVKAVTWHRFEARQMPGGTWRAVVVLDV